MFNIDGIPVLAGVDDIIYRLKREVATNGIEVFKNINNRNSNYLMISCPYHSNTRTPDMQVSKVKSSRFDAGFCYCHGCHHKVSLVELVSNVLGYNDFGVAGKKWILDRFATFELENREGMFNRLGNSTHKHKIEYVSEDILDTYRYTHPYMYTRHLTDELINWYDVGYDRSINAITFPVRDINGKCLFVATRSVTDKFYKYPKDVDKPLYGIYEISKLFPDAHCVYICESFLNAMMLVKWGKPAIALMGTGSESQYELLRKLPYRKFIIATDSDVAGNLGAKKLVYELGNHKLLSRLIILDEGKDINDLGSCESFNQFMSHCKEVNVFET